MSSITASTVAAALPWCGHLQPEGRTHPTRRPGLTLAPVAFVALLLTGCGAEVAGTAATVAATQAAQASQAQSQQARLVEGFKQAQDAGAARAASAADDLGR
jgi:hypothetical protein